jgi:WD40 repeat protein
MTNRTIVSKLKLLALLGLFASASLAADEPKLRTTLEAGALSSLAFSPDGKVLVSGSHDATIRLWDLRTGREQAVLKGHTSPVWSVAISPDGKTLASACGPTIRLTDPDGKERGAGMGEPTIKLWDLATAKELRTLLGHTNLIAAVAFSPDGKTLASGSHDKTMKLWDVATGKEQATLKAHTAPVTSVAYSPDGKTLASGSSDETIRLWDAEGKVRLSLKGHTRFIGAVWSVAFSADGRTVASGSYDTTIKLWDVETGREQASFEEHANPVYSVALSPNGKTLASGSHDKTVKLWDMSTVTVRAALAEHTDVVRSVMFSPDGKTLATLGNGQIKLWDLPGDE